jgi:transposase
MARVTTQIDEQQLRSLHQQGLSQQAIATRLNTSKATVARKIKALGFGIPVQESAESPPQVDSGPSEVLREAPPDELAELKQWWQERQAALAQASDASRQTERMTFHVEHRWIEALRRQADLDGLTYTQVVNAAFRQYFQGMSTSGLPPVDAPLLVRAVATLEAATERAKAELRAAVPRPVVADDLEEMPVEDEAAVVARPAAKKRGRARR